GWGSAGPGRAKARGAAAPERRVLLVSRRPGEPLHDALRARAACAARRVRPVAPAGAGHARMEVRARRAAESRQNGRTLDRSAGLWSLRADRLSQGARGRAGARAGREMDGTRPFEPARSDCVRARVGGAGGGAAGPSRASAGAPRERARRRAYGSGHRHLLYARAVFLALVFRLGREARVPAAHDGRAPAEGPAHRGPVAVAALEPQGQRMAL